MISLFDPYADFPHGGDYTGTLLDFSTNIAPLGMPDSVQNALDGLWKGDELTHYPDPYCIELRQVIAGQHGLAPEQVLCGSGAVELLYDLCRTLRPKRALIVEPTFSEYEKALTQVDCQVEHFLPDTEWCFGLEDSFFPEDAKTLPRKLPKQFADRLTSEPDLLVLCSPNNPTGVSFSAPLLDALLDYCAGRNIRVLWDASFLELSSDLEQMQLLPTGCMQTRPGLLVLKSLTKTYAIPGLRLGYLLSSDTELLTDIEEQRAPWAVSTPAQAAGVAALQDDEYLPKLRTFLAEEREFMTGALTNLNVVPLTPGDCREGVASQRNYFLQPSANFFFARFQTRDMVQQLRNHNILVRDCSNFYGLDDHYIRFSIRTRSENEQLLSVLKEVLSGEE